MENFVFPQVVTDVHTAFLLGLCKSRIETLLHTPILPSERASLSKVALIKGVQATTAIEGNTLSEEEIGEILDGKRLPLSQRYQQQEVENTLSAMQAVFDADLTAESVPIITTQLIKNFHLLIGQNLGENFSAIPGKFRTNNVTVGPYRPPGYEEIPELMEQFCKWLREVFNYGTKTYKLETALKQAISAHVVFEWIHPFGDGNGRTGRLIEYHILARAGVPDIACHLLSNHYNLTRGEYYHLLNTCRLSNNMADFLQYALQGLADGLDKQLNTIAIYLRRLAWREHVYICFEKHPDGQKEVINRKRDLAKILPFDRSVDVLEFLAVENPRLAKMYYKLDDKTLARDIDMLAELGLVEKLKTGVIRAKAEELDLRYSLSRKLV